MHDNERDRDVRGKFNPRELRLIETLRRQERRWPRWRWLLLSLALGFASSAALAGHLLWLGISGLGDAGKTETAILILSFLCTSQALLSVLILGMVFTCHPINSRRKLLVKLADALGESATTDAKDS